MPTGDQTQPDNFKPKQPKIRVGCGLCSGQPDPLAPLPISNIDKKTSQRRF